MPVVLISLVSFVSSMSVAQTFALRHGQRVDADRELLDGAGQCGKRRLGCMAVSGGLSRSVVERSRWGARSPLAGVITSVAWLSCCGVSCLDRLPSQGRLGCGHHHRRGRVGRHQGLRAAWA